MGAIAVFECEQRIPCNPCAEACPRGAIRFPGGDINDCPTVDASLCNGCGMCLTRCPGLSIFIIDPDYSPGEALIKMPYEFAPLPARGERVDAIGKNGKKVGTALVDRVQTSRNKTAVVWITLPRQLAGEVRHIRRQGGTDNE